MKTAYTSGQLVKLSSLLEQKGVSAESFQVALETGVMSEVAEAIATVNLIELKRETLRRGLGLLPDPAFITVDFNLSPRKMMARANFSKDSLFSSPKLHPRIFQSNEKGQVCYETKLFRMEDEKLVPGEAEMLIPKLGPSNPKKRWQPAGPAHLLAFATTYPDEQRKYTIVAFGPPNDATTEPYTGVLCINGGPGFRRLYQAGRVGGGTWKTARYLAVRKVSN